jgi:hypothetical protein
MKRIKISVIFLAAVSFIIFMGGCSDTMQEESQDPYGTISVSITDSPFDIDLVESALVTITALRIREAGGGDTAEVYTLMEDTVTVDLMKLRNGKIEELAETDIPAGSYDLITIITSEAKLILKDGDEFSLKIPGGEETGIKVKIAPAIAVEGAISSELLLDFDLSRSFVMKGNVNKPGKINGFNFKPVVRAVNLSTAGRVEGKVTDTKLNKLVSASVYIMKDTVIVSAFTDTLGMYVIPGIPAGTYKMYAKKEKYDSLVFEGVKVLGGSSTIRNFALKSEQ